MHYSSITAMQTHIEQQKNNIADQPYEHRTIGVPLALWSCLMSSICDETIDRTVQRAPFALYTGRPQQGKRHKVYDEQWTDDAIKVNANWPIYVPTLRTMKNLETRVDDDAAVLSQWYSCTYAARTKNIFRTYDTDVNI